MSLFQKNVPLAPYTNYKIGGPAKYFFEARTSEQLQAALREAQALGERLFILGGGYNLLVSDEGFDGVVIKPHLTQLSVDENRIVTVGAGVLVADFLDFCIEHNLSGWEWAGGLPSTMGGAVWGNAGAFGGETKDRVISVTSMNVETGVVSTRTKEQCAFNYRSSIFKTNQQHSNILENVGMFEVILEAQFQLELGDRATIAAVIEEKKAYRRNKQPLELPNCGSVFKNTPVERIPPETLAQFKEKIKNDPFPVLPTAVLNAAAGLKGYRVGDAQVSEKHANFIVNLGQARAADVRAVMAHVKQTIKEKFGVELEQEVIFVGS